MILGTVSLSKSIFVESILHHFAVFEEAFRLCSEREMKKGHRQETETTEMPDVDALGQVPGHMDDVASESSS